MLFADMDNVASEVSNDRCTSRLFTVQSLTGHNGVVTALAMSDRVLVTARSVVYRIDLMVVSA